MANKAPQPKFNQLLETICPQCGRPFKTESGYVHHWINKHSADNSTSTSAPLSPEQE